MHDPGDAPLVTVLCRFNQFESRNEEYGASREARRVWHEPRQLGVDSTKVSDNSQYEVLAAAALSAGQRTGQGIEENIDSLASVQPPGHQVCGSGPGGLN
jgi:hypothetical protein